MSSGRTIALDLDHGPPVPSYWAPPPPTGSGKWLHDKPSGGIEWATITPADVGLDRLAGQSYFGASVAGIVTAQPLINWYTNPDGTGDVLKWQTGLDASNGMNDDLVLAAHVGGASVADFVYVRSNPNSLSLGVGYTPPPDKAALAVSGADGSDTRALVLRIGPGTTGDAFQVYDSAGTPLLRILSNGNFRVANVLPLNDPGTIVFLPTTPGNSGQAVVQFRSNAVSGTGVDLLPTGNDMTLQVSSSVNGGAVWRVSGATNPIARLSPQTDMEGFRINQAPGTPASYMFTLVNNANSAYVGGFDKAGTFFTFVHAAPPDAEISAGQMFVWFDQTSGAAKLMVKAKDAGGTVRTGSLALT